MSIFKRRFKKDSGADSDAGGGQSLYLHISDMGWQMQVIGETGELVGERRSEDCSLMTGEISDRMEAIQGRAVKALSRAERRRIGRVHIMLSDQATVLLDDAGGEFEGAGPDALRQIGQRQLNCQSASYGVCELTAAAGGGQLYGMTDAAVLRNMLHNLDDMALRVVEVTPTAALLTRWAMGLDRPYCALILDAYNSKIVVTDGANRNAVVRTLPIGIMSFPAAVADKTRVKLPKAQDGLRQRDVIATLDIGADGDDAVQRLSKGPFHDAMAPLLRALKREVEATLHYMTDQRLSRRPETIEVFGEHGKVKGLDNWLTANMDLSVEFTQQDMFNLFMDKDVPAKMNLLTGADGPLITVGKIKYKYSKDGFVEDVVAPVADINIKRRSNLRSRGRQRGGGRGRGGRGRPNANQGGLFGLSFLSFGGEQASPSGQANSQRIYPLLLALVFFGLLYWGYNTYYDVALQRHHSARANYAAAMQANNTAWEKLRSQRSKSTDLSLRARRDEDKVLWSEKMLTLARHMDDKMWISDVYLTNESASFNDQSVSARKLTIEGAVLPSTHGHILEIARYISRLTADKLFMRDFARVTFEGAAIDTQEAAHIVKFTLDAWYDETKVVTEIREGGGGPTGGLARQINRRTDALEQVRDGTN